MKELTQLDVAQIARHSFDEQKAATRVIMVDGLKIDTTEIEHCIKDAFKNIDFPRVQTTTSQHIQIPTIIKETEIKVIEVPVIIKEIEYKEIPVPFIKYETIEKQLIVEKPTIMQVEKPIIVKEYKELPSWIKYAVSIMLFIQILNLFLKH